MRLKHTGSASRIAGLVATVVLYLGIFLISGENITVAIIGAIVAYLFGPAASDLGGKKAEKRQRRSFISGQEVAVAYASGVLTGFGIGALIMILGHGSYATALVCGYIGYVTVSVVVDMLLEGVGKTTEAPVEPASEITLSDRPKSTSSNLSSL